MTMRLPRTKFTIVTLMAVVACFAIVANSIRPISESEAVGLATARFRQIPGASAWATPVVRSRLSDGGNGRFYWIVNFLDPADDRAIAQVSTDERGKVVSVVVSISGSAVPVPVGLVTEPIPPPK